MNKDLALHVLYGVGGFLVLLIVVAAVALLLIGCSGDAPPPPGQPGTPAAPVGKAEQPAGAGGEKAEVAVKAVGPSAPAGTYVEETVSGGGAIGGLCSFAGAEIPHRTEVPVDTNVEHCGHKVMTENRIVDAASRGLKNVVVTVEGIQKGKKRAAEVVTVTNRNCSFEPHVSAAMVGSKIEITNSDPILHTTHSFLGISSFFNVPLQPAQPGLSRPLRRVGLLKLTCDVHKWMTGWLVVHSNPYFAVSAADGRFEIAELPPGTYTVTAWHEDLGKQTAQATVESGKTAQLEFEFGKTPSAEPAVEAVAVAPPAAAAGLSLPLGLDPEEVKIPADNPLTPEKIELGRALYFDPRLSKDDTVSCASCHDPRKGYSNGERFATGVNGQVGGRSAPPVINRVFSTLQFWDGRAATLEAQALGPIQNPIEMAMSLDALVPKLGAVRGYRELFKKAFGSEEVTPPRIAQAIASFERTLVSGDSPFDRHEQGDRTALSDSAKRGLNLFRTKAKCSVCHTGFNLTDEKYHNIGVGMKAEKPDPGRADQTKNAADTGAFKTPSLREIALTAPYMHDGSQKTLEEVVDYYDKGGETNAHLDKEIKPLKLTPEEKKDLVEILKAFSGKLTIVEAPRDRLQ